MGPHSCRDLPYLGRVCRPESLTLDRRMDTFSLKKGGKKNEILAEAGKFERDKKGSCLHGLASSVG